MVKTAQFARGRVWQAPAPPERRVTTRLAQQRGERHGSIGPVPRRGSNQGLHAITSPGESRETKRSLNARNRGVKKPERR